MEITTKIDFRPSVRQAFVESAGDEIQAIQMLNRASSTTDLLPMLDTFTQTPRDDVSEQSLKVLTVSGDSFLDQETQTPRSVTHKKKKKKKKKSEDSSYFQGDEVSRPLTRARNRRCTGVSSVSDVNVSMTNSLISDSTSVTTSDTSLSQASYTLESARVIQTAKTCQTSFSLPSESLYTTETSFSQQSDQSSLKESSLPNQMVSGNVSSLPNSTMHIYKSSSASVHDSEEQHIYKSSAASAQDSEEQNERYACPGNTQENRAEMGNSEEYYSYDRAGEKEPETQNISGEQQRETPQNEEAKQLSTQDSAVCDDDPFWDDTEKDIVEVSYGSSIVKSCKIEDRKDWSTELKSQSRYATPRTPDIITVVNTPRDEAENLPDDIVINDTSVEETCRGNVDLPEVDEDPRGDTLLSSLDESKENYVGNFIGEKSQNKNVAYRKFTSDYCYVPEDRGMDGESYVESEPENEMYIKSSSQTGIETKDEEDLDISRGVIPPKRKVSDSSSHCSAIRAVGDGCPIYRQEIFERPPSRCSQVSSVRGSGKSSSIAPVLDEAQSGNMASLNETQDLLTEDELAKMIEDLKIVDEAPPVKADFPKRSPSSCSRGSGDVPISCHSSFLRGIEETGLEEELMPDNQERSVEQSPTESRGNVDVDASKEHDNASEAPAENSSDTSSCRGYGHAEVCSSGVSSRGKEVDKNNTATTAPEMENSVTDLKEGVAKADLLESKVQDISSFEDNLQCASSPQGLDDGFLVPTPSEGTGENIVDTETVENETGNDDQMLNSGSGVEKQMSHTKDENNHTPNEKEITTDNQTQDSNETQGCVLDHSYLSTTRGDFAEEPSLEDAAVRGGTTADQLPGISLNEGLPKTEKAFASTDITIANELKFTNCSDKISTEEGQESGTTSEFCQDIQVLPVSSEVRKRSSSAKSPRKPRSVSGRPAGHCPDSAQERNEIKPQECPEDKEDPNLILNESRGLADGVLGETQKLLEEKEKMEGPQDTTSVGFDADNTIVMNESRGVFEQDEFEQFKEISEHDQNGASIDDPVLDEKTKVKNLEALNQYVTNKEKLNNNQANEDINTHCQETNLNETEISPETEDLENTGTPDDAANMTADYSMERGETTDTPREVTVVAAPRLQRSPSVCSRGSVSEEFPPTDEPGERRPEENSLAAESSVENTPAAETSGENALAAEVSGENTPTAEASGENTLPAEASGENTLAAETSGANTHADKISGEIATESSGENTLATETSRENTQTNELTQEKKIPVKSNESSNENSATHDPSNEANLSSRETSTADPEENLSASGPFDECPKENTPATEQSTEGQELTSSASEQYSESQQEIPPARTPSNESQQESQLACEPSSEYPEEPQVQASNQLRVNELNKTKTEIKSDITNKKSDVPKDVDTNVHLSHLKQKENQPESDEVNEKSCNGLVEESKIEVLDTITDDNAKADEHQNTESGEPSRGSVDEDFPKVDDDTRKGGDDIPKVDDDTARADDDTAKVDDDTPKVDDDIPKVDYDTARADDDTAKVDDDTPKVDDDTPKVDDDAPKVDDDASKVDDKTARIDDDAPKVNDDTPKVDDDTPKPKVEQSVRSIGDNSRKVEEKKDTVRKEAIGEPFGSVDEENEKVGSPAKQVVENGVNVKEDSIEEENKQPNDASINGVETGLSSMNFFAEEGNADVQKDSLMEQQKGNPVHSSEVAAEDAIIKGSTTSGQPVNFFTGDESEIFSPDQTFLQSSITGDSTIFLSAESTVTTTASDSSQIESSTPENLQYVTLQPQSSQDLRSPEDLELATKSKSDEHALKEKGSVCLSHTEELTVSEEGEKRENMVETLSLQIEESEKLTHVPGDHKRRMSTESRGSICSEQEATLLSSPRADGSFINGNISLLPDEAVPQSEQYINGAPITDLPAQQTDVGEGEKPVSYSNLSAVLVPVQQKKVSNPVDEKIPEEASPLESYPKEVDFNPRDDETTIVDIAVLPQASSERGSDGNEYYSFLNGKESAGDNNEAESTGKEEEEMSNLSFEIGEAVDKTIEMIVSQESKIRHTPDKDADKICTQIQEEVKGNVTSNTGKNEQPILLVYDSEDKSLIKRSSGNVLVLDQKSVPATLTDVITPKETSSFQRGEGASEEISSHQEEKDTPKGLSEYHKGEDAPEETSPQARDQNASDINSATPNFQDAPEVVSVHQKDEDVQEVPSLLPKDKDAPKDVCVHQIEENTPEKTSPHPEDVHAPEETSSHQEEKDATEEPCANQEDVNAPEEPSAHPEIEDAPEETSAHPEDVNAPDEPSALLEETRGGEEEDLEDLATSKQTTEAENCKGGKSETLNTHETRVTQDQTDIVEGSEETKGSGSGKVGGSTEDSAGTNGNLMPGHKIILVSENVPPPFPKAQIIGKDVDGSQLILVSEKPQV